MEEEERYEIQEEDVFLELCTSSSTFNAWSKDPSSKSIPVMFLFDLRYFNNIRRHKLDKVCYIVTWKQHISRNISCPCCACVAGGSQYVLMACKELHTV